MTRNRMGENFEGEYYEMDSHVMIHEGDENKVEIGIDTGASLERFTLSREQFDKVNRLAQNSELPTDVFIDRAVAKFGFGKDLFKKILSEATPESEE